MRDPRASPRARSLHTDQALNGLYDEDRGQSAGRHREASGVLESAWRDVSRGALEAVALEGYRDRTLSREQIGRILGLSFGETEAFLKARQPYLAYDEQGSASSAPDDRRLGYIADQLPRPDRVPHLLPELFDLVLIPEAVQ